MSSQVAYEITKLASNLKDLNGILSNSLPGIIFYIFMALVLVSITQSLSQIANHLGTLAGHEKKKKVKALEIMV